MKRNIIFALSCLLLLAAVVPAAGEVRQLDLGLPVSDGEMLQVKETGSRSLVLEFSLPSLNIEEITVADEVYQGLTIPGGNLRGEPGQAGLPTVGRLLAVPDNASVQVRVKALQERKFSEMRVFPVQPDEGSEFVVDRDYYSSGQPDRPSLVEVGEPAILHGLRVVPLTLSPVRYDPVQGEVTVASRFEIEVDFSGLDTRNGVAPRRSVIPESFARMYENLVVNYRSDGTEVGPGSYLIITPNDSGVESDLQSLLNLRRRQGYNVVLATTAQTGSTNSSIKNYIQNAFNTYDPPLEFVVLAGDAGGSYSIPCWYESASGYGGEGDHYYTTLAGGDMLADVHIGRLSYRNRSTLQGIVNKIYQYETNPPTVDAGWFTRASLAGDTGSSGITCIYVNQWVKSQLLDIGYTQVDTIWGGNFVSLMTGDLNAGCTVFGYRGWLGMSGMSASNIMYLSNGYELPFAVIPTCDSGSFADDDNSRSEAFLRNAGGGGIGGIGTATLGTHTRYNNCYYMGAWDGALNRDDGRLGVAHSYGKLMIYLHYINYEYSRVEIWSMWNNLMGDPATRMWTAFPSNFTVDHEATMPVGANSLPVQVSSGGSPVQDALVTLYQSGTVRFSGYTDFAGQVHLPAAGAVAGELRVTVTKRNFIPYQGITTIGTVGVYPAYADATVDDDGSGGSSGNGDGAVNPGETIELPVALQNLGTSSANNVTATLSSSDPYVTVTDGTESFGTIPAGSTVWSGEDFDFTVAANAPAGRVLDFDLVATSGGTDYTSLIQLTVSSAAFDFEAYSWSGPGGTLDPGESGNFTLTVRNNGDITGSSVTATLASSSPWITVTDGSGSFGTVAPGATANNGGDPFGLSILSDCFDGHLATFTLTCTFNGGMMSTSEFSLTVGSTSSNDPLGPDAYGYYAFDNTDTGYPDAPTYSWQEIDPNYGGSGVSVGLSDFGWEQDDTNVLGLPFTFQYYGETYDQLSICSNGWISLGVTSLVPYHNRYIPGPGAPPNLIAPYWDNLYQSGTNVVYYRHDSENDTFIVQWSRVRADYNNNTQNVQVILYDPAAHPTATGDGMILFQYHTVSNTDSRDAYASVGISNGDRSDGLLYTYGGDYSAGAATLTAGRAIKFVPFVAVQNAGTLTGEVTNSSNGGTAVAGASIVVVGTSHTMTSQADGSYAGGVEAGTYDVRAEHPSFSPVTVEDVVINVGEITEVDFALTDILGPSIQNTTVLPHTDDTVGPYVVNTYITDYSAISEMHFYYRISHGATQEAALTLIDPPTGHYRAEIPGQSYNTEVEYWIEATDVAANQSRDPEGTDTYSFWVLEEATVFHDDFETSQGWTVGDTGDDATTGIWVRVDPNGVWDGGTEIQPEDDATVDPGVMCFITGNDPPGSSQGTDDVDGGKTTLKSPVFDLADALSVTVSYRRWYTNDTGSNPGSDYWVVEVNDGSGWVTLENTNATDRSWSLHSFLLDDYVELTSTVQFRFIASDEGGGSVVEAGVDEFLLTGFTIPDPTPVIERPLPVRLALHQNHPNPFNPQTRLRFDLPHEQAVSLRIYDISGRLVRTLLDGVPLPAGYHQYTWNGRDNRASRVGSGLYFFVLDTQSGRLTGKMTLIK